MNRFYLPFHAGSDMVWMDRSESHHILHVKRLKIGNSIILFNGMGAEYSGEIVEIKENRVKVKLNAQQPISKEKRVEIDIAFAIPKGKRSRFLIQKCTELGAHKFIPTHFERSIVRLTGGGAVKIEKWQKIAVEAAKQCGRNTIPEICEAQDFDHILKNINRYDIPLFACNHTDSQSIGNTLQDQSKPNTIISFIGPEGGFTSQEIEMAKKSGCRFVSLGRRTLRVETAAIAVSAILSCHYSV